MREITQDQNFNNHRISTIFHDAGNKKIVIFCHGYRGTNIGPNRFFVRAARLLAERGISSLRFDQYGSGNSEGDFFDSSFTDWTETIKAITQNYFKQGYKIALFGQSMGGAAIIAVGAEILNLSAMVVWVPDPNVEDFISPQNGVIEENGQIVQARFWQEAHDTKIVEKLRLIKMPVYIVQCTNDEYVDEQNRNAIVKNVQANVRVDIFEGYSHNKWTYKQSEEIIDKSVNFLLSNFT